LLPGKAGQARCGCALCLALASELAHGRLLGLLEAARADPGKGLGEASPERALALLGAQASPGAECGLTAPGDVASPSSDVLLGAALKDVLHGLLNHALLKRVVELAGHERVEGPSCAADQARGLAQGPAELASCLLSPALHVGQALAKAAGGCAGHAELLPDAALKGADTAPEGLGSSSNALAKLASRAAGDVLNFAEAPAKLACGLLSDAHRLGDVPAELVVDPAADALNATQGLPKLASRLLGGTLCGSDLAAKDIGGRTLLLAKLPKAAGKLRLGSEGLLSPELNTAENVPEACLAKLLLGGRAALNGLEGASLSGKLLPLTGC